MTSCRCKAKEPIEGMELPSSGRPAGRTFGALVLGILVAFFPKCPMCWAAYCSAFGFAGPSELPYQKFLLPLLVGLLLLHLFLLWKQTPKIGFCPFLMSLTGVASLLLFRYYASGPHWGLNSGILLIVAGSAWNSFTMRNQASKRGRVLTDPE